MANEHYLPIIFVALVVLVLGAWNPTALQAKTSAGKPSGYPDYKWLAALSALGGLLTVWAYRVTSR